MTSPCSLFFRYSILDKDCPIGIHPITGQLSTLRKLDRELEATHVFQVKAQEEPSGASHNGLLMLFLLNNRTSDGISEPCVTREGVSGRTVSSVELFWINGGMGALKICVNLTYCHITWWNPCGKGRKITLAALPSFTRGSQSKLCIYRAAVDEIQRSILVDCHDV